MWKFTIICNFSSNLRIFDLYALYLLRIHSKLDFNWREHLVCTPHKFKTCNQTTRRSRIIILGRTVNGFQTAPKLIADSGGLFSVTPKSSLIFVLSLESVSTTASLLVSGCSFDLLIKISPRSNSNIAWVGANTSADARKLKKRRIAAAMATLPPDPVRQIFAATLQSLWLKTINVIPSVKKAIPSKMLHVVQAIVAILKQDIRSIVSQAKKLKIGAKTAIALAALSDGVTCRASNPIH